MKKNYFIKTLVIFFITTSAMQSKAACKTDTTYVYSFDTFTNAKEVTSRYIYTYTSFDSIAQFLAQSWDPTNTKWIGIIKRNRNYNPNNLMKEEIVYSWDATTATFLHYTQEILTYNGSNQHTKSDINFWDASTSTWENGTKRTFNYNGQGKLSEEIEELWNSSSATWQNYFQLTYTYNISGDMDTMQRNGWDMASSKWYNYHLFVYKYNAAKQLTEDYWFEDGGATWINKELIEYSYNLNGTLKKKTLREWDDMAGVYTRGDDVFYTYNSDGDLQYEDIYFDWRAADNKHKKHTQLEHICAKTGLGIASLTLKNKTIIYPNPLATNGQLNIVAEIESNFQIFSLEGKEIAAGFLKKGENQLSLHLFPGLYLFRIQNQTTKVIIQ